MKTNKILIGGIVGGVAFFFLGWVIYGMLLAGYMKANMNQCAMLPMDQMIWWALILSNFGWGFLLAVIFGWTNTTGWKAGAGKGAIIGLLTCLPVDLGMFAMSTMYPNLGAIIVDVLAVVVMAAIAGALVGQVMGTAKKEG